MSYIDIPKPRGRFDALLKFTLYTLAIVLISLILQSIFSNVYVTSLGVNQFLQRSNTHYIFSKLGLNIPLIEPKINIKKELSFAEGVCNTFYILSQVIPILFGYFIVCAAGAIYGVFGAIYGLFIGSWKLLALCIVLGLATPICAALSVVVFPLLMWLKIMSLSWPFDPLYFVVMSFTGIPLLVSGIFISFSLVPAQAEYAKAIIIIFPK